MKKNKVILRTTKTSSMRKMKTNRMRKTMRLFSLGHKRSEESTHITIMRPPNMVGGVKRAWRVLMCCTSWSRKTGDAHMMLRWKRCFWNVPFGTLLIASEEVKKINVAGTAVGDLVDVQGGVVQPAWWESDDESTSSEHLTLERV
jgi:hypothetical protein